MSEKLKWLHDSFYHARISSIEQVMRGQNVPPEALSIIEAVLEGADVNDGWWYGTDCWSVIKPYDKPCPTCGGDKVYPCTSSEANPQGYSECPECGGSGEVPQNMWNGIGYTWMAGPCPTCGTGKEA